MNSNYHYNSELRKLNRKVNSPEIANIYSDAILNGTALDRNLKQHLACSANGGQEWNMPHNYPRYRDTNGTLWNAMQYPQLFNLVNGKHTGMKKRYPANLDITFFDPKIDPSSNQTLQQQLVENYYKYRAQLPPPFFDQPSAPRNYRVTYNYDPYLPSPNDSRQQRLIKSMYKTSPYGLDVSQGMNDWGPNSIRNKVPDGAKAYKRYGRVSNVHPQLFDF